MMKMKLNEISTTDWSGQKENFDPAREAFRRAQ